MTSQTKASKFKKPLSTPKPSASILLVSPTNQILLLHRVRTSSSFPSAHVFPGGNLSSEQDGEVPGPTDPARHEDSKVYRLGAIRECFEESGLLLATKKESPKELLRLSDDEREQGRHAIHEDKVSFRQWVDQKSGIPDIDGLIPFTRWITPTNIPKRFTTQMYIYFLPVAKNESSSAAGPLPVQSEALIPTPTSDGGIEHTAARFLPPSKWLSMSQAGEIILFPPQFFLLHLLSPFLSPEDVPTVLDPEGLSRQREVVLNFVKSGDPPWGEKCMSPIGLFWKESDGRAVLGLDKPGPELEGSGKRGDAERVVLVDFRKEGPRKVEVAWKKDVFQSEREGKEKL
ncbi:NUDIX hydrolase domain-like [Lasallia pustulata]|nr:NUDIX hydrolase domain-like [Lasallia pustulata]